jgi:putative colanic acid biosynthesis acetyltransferase WcaF
MPGDAPPQPPQPHEPAEGFPKPTLVGPGRTFQRFDRCADFPYARSEYLRRALWALVRGTLFRFSPSRLYAFRRFLLRLFGATLGPHAKVWPSATIKHPWLLTMGEHATIAEHAEVYNLGYVTLGAHVTISQHAYLCAGTHDYKREDFPLLRPPITVGDGAWVCAHAFVGPNVRIGDNAILAGGAVALRDVPADMIAVGNPATPVRGRPRHDPASPRPNEASPIHAATPDQ